MTLTIDPKVKADIAEQWAVVRKLCRGSHRRDARNDLTHRAKFAGKQECFDYIYTIETELEAWGVL